MNSTRNLTLAAGLALLAGLTVALYEAHRAHAAEIAARALGHQTDSASDELQKLAARRIQLDRMTAELRQDRDQVQNRPKPPSTPEGTLDSEDPILLRKAVIRARASAALRYRALFQSLHLAPEQEKKLEGIIEDYELHARDVWETGNVQGVSTADPALWQLMRPDYEKMRAEVTDLLGPAGFQQVDQYNRTLAARDFSTALVASLYYTPTPLSAPQADQLVSVLASLSPSYQQGHAAVDLYTIDWSQAPQLAGVLSPAQITALQSVMAARQAYVKLTPLVNSPIGPVINAAGQSPAPTAR